MHKTPAKHFEVCANFVQKKKKKQYNSWCKNMQFQVCACLYVFADVNGYPLCVDQKQAESSVWLDWLMPLKYSLWHHIRNPCLLCENKKKKQKQKQNKKLTQKQKPTERREAAGDNGINLMRNKGGSYKTGILLINSYSYFSILPALYQMMANSVIMVCWSD